MPTPGLGLRPASPLDLPTLVAIERDSFDLPWSRETLEPIVDRQDAWVAERGREVVATALFQTVLDESELLRLAVVQHGRRAGIGRALLRHGLAELRRRGVEHCFLEVRADNQAALGLYRALGFRTTGRRARYYSDGTDALLFSRRLGSS